MPQTLHPKAVAQTALDNFERLGAIAGKKQCQYDYGDGTRCMIGMSFSDETMKIIRNDTAAPSQVRQELNTKSVSWLVELGIVAAAPTGAGDGYDNSMLALDVLQLAHDNLARGYDNDGGRWPGWGHLVPPPIKAFLREHDNKHITPAGLRAFLEVVVSAYP